MLIKLINSLLKNKKAFNFETPSKSYFWVCFIDECFLWQNTNTNGLLHAISIYVRYVLAHAILFSCNA